MSRHAVVISVLMALLFLPGIGPALAQSRENGSAAIQVCIAGMDCFPASSMGFGCSQNGTLNTGGGGNAERVSITDISLRRQPDLNSPELFRLCCKGQHVPSATISVTHPDGSSMDIGIAEFIVTEFSVQTTANRGTVEVIRLNFARICLETTEGGTSTDTCWDMEKNQELLLGASNS